MLTNVSRTRSILRVFAARGIPRLGVPSTLPLMSWKVHPEPADPEELAALVAAAEQALAPPEESAWWRSGLEDLDDGTPADQARHDPGVVEP